MMPETDWLTLHAAAPADSPGDVIRLRAARREAAARLARLADWVGVPMPFRMTEWFDWDRLRVNVTHLVEPGMVRWR